MYRMKTMEIPKIDSTLLVTWRSELCLRSLGSITRDIRVWESATRQFRNDILLESLAYFGYSVLLSQLTLSCTGILPAYLLV